MANEQKVDRLKNYVEMITKKHGGIEAQIETLKKQPRPEATEGPLESLPVGPSKVERAQAGLEQIQLDRTPSVPEASALEAIINEDLRPAVYVQDGTFTMTHPLWTRLSQDTAIKQRIEQAIPSIGRIELPGSQYPYGGTGFVVGEGLIMTNRHVAELFAAGLGEKRLNFLDGSKAGIDFLQEQDRPTGPMLSVRKVVMIHPYWDVAILSVEGLPATRQPLKLSLKDARDMVGHDIFVVGYPAFDGRNPSDVQQNLFDGHFGVKRLQPGQLQGGMKTSSFAKMVPAATHDCSTLGGNSGSAVIDLDTGEVLALHFGGLYHEKNYCVPAFELSRDDRVIATGIKFAGAAGGGEHDWDDWWARADATEAPASAAANAGPARSGTAVQMQQGPGVFVKEVDPGSATTAGGTVTIDVPLRITISLGQPGTVSAVVRTESVAAQNFTEALSEPFRDTDFSSRTGYDPDFLNAPGQDHSLTAVRVPLPTPADPSVLAKAKDGATLLRYENFSIAMHATRRLALFTASNVTKEPNLRKPDPSADYSRRGLSGLGPNDQERWYLDPRLDDKFQLPDVFFTKDRGAFDKGHIVRRDDVAWGRTYPVLRRANGDTYHVTNCSPQVAGFNRSNAGEQNWGDLENVVLSEAANERLCLFAGPVLEDSDEVFVGKGDGGVTLRAKVPKRFWKLIVSRVEDGIAAYGFVLEQDLSNVSLTTEFVVPAEFVPSMAPIADIESMTGVSFGDDVRNADQFDTVRGGEVSLRGRVRRKKPR
jgi:endonuclease G, mitochondrial